MKKQRVLSITMPEDTYTELIYINLKTGISMGSLYKLKEKQPHAYEGLSAAIEVNEHGSDSEQKEFKKFCDPLVEKLRTSLKKIK